MLKTRSERVADSERRRARSRLERFKPMADFDWNWPKKIDRHLVESAVRLDFIESARNVVLVAPQGLGKTMISQNIAHQAILEGTASLLRHRCPALAGSRRPGVRARTRAAPQALRARRTPDHRRIGFLAFDNRNADLLFQVVSRRYEKKSLVLTTNLAFRDWPTIFPNATCATALIDRVIHHADVIAIEGESYRAREAQQSAKARRAGRKKEGDET
ncbi:MAG: ATP-binding protein [Myxococcales bacterium]|nr:ATP-binding protein [Myxococcales bacterium]